VRLAPRDSLCAHPFVFCGKLLGYFVPGMDLNFDDVSDQLRLGSYQVCSGMGQVYGRFMGGSGQNMCSPGQFRQSLQFMHIMQSRINTGCFGSC
jgi:hypothetical protein